MTAEQIRAAIAADPQMQAMADAGDHTGIVAHFSALDDPLRTAPRPLTFATSRTLVGRLGPAGAVTMKKLRGFAAAAEPEDPTVYALQATVQEMLPFISQGDPDRGDGVDVGSPGPRALFQALTQIGVLTKDDATAILEIGAPPCSRAFALWGQEVTLNEISEALNNGE
jgi:hypothetical protein